MLSNRSLFKFFLWWAVIGFSIWFGGTIFSISVIVPMWSEALPESARTFFSQTSFSTHIYNFFGPPWMVLRNFPLLIALFIGWNSVQHRKYLLIAAGILITAVLFTLIHVYPINNDLMIKAGAGYNDEDLTQLARHWIWADRIRLAVMVIGYFYLLKAFRLPYPVKD